MKGNKKTMPQSLWPSRIVAIALWITVPSLGLHAEDAQGPAPEYTAACGDMAGYMGKTEKEIETISNSTMRMRINYCKAAQSSQFTRSYSIVAATLWAGASAFCFVSCAKQSSVFPATVAAGTAMAPFCAWGAVGLGVADTGVQVTVAALAKEYTSAATSAATGVAGIGTTVAANVISKANPCVAGVTSALQAGLAGLRIGMSQAAMETNLRSASTLLSEKSGVTPNEKPVNNASTALTGAGSGVGGVSGSGDGSIARPSAAKDDPIAREVCEEAARTRTYAPLVNCAKSGGDIPNALFQPEFVESFKKNMGQDVQSFINSGGNVASALNTALSGPLGSEAAGRFASAINAQNNHVRTELEKASSVYASSGGGGRSGARASASAFPNFGDLMKDIMGNMPGAKKAETTPASQGSARFGGSTAGRPHIEDDPTVSLFDRVSVRYQEKTPDVSSGAADWSTPTNRAAHGIK